jgi:hypothetical protein
MPKSLRWIALLLVFSTSSIPGASKSAIAGSAEGEHGGKAVLWRDPTDIATRNLFFGSGGEARQPRGTLTFIREDLEGSNPKLDVRDEAGVKWKVKIGVEARPEVVASRFVWAAGYFATDDYFIESTHIQGLPDRLHRGGQDWVGPDGALHDLRLKGPVRWQEKTGIWRWESNPFFGTQEFNGLRVLMALMNNWDVKDVNNAVYKTKPGDSKGSGNAEQVYLVSDLGATFGSTGVKVPLDVAKGNLESYKASKFITNVTAEYVDFGAPSRPTLIDTVRPRMFIQRLGLRWIGRGIPRADAKWIGQVLGRLSREQIRDAFRAAGFAPQEVDGFATVVQDRIAQLKAL